MLKKRWAGYKHTLFKNPNAPSTTLSYNMLKCKNTNQKSKINLSIKSKAHAFPSGRAIVYTFPKLIFCWISAHIMSLCEISNQFSLCFVLIPDSTPEMKSHPHLHAMSIWLHLVPKLHTAGANNIFPAHNAFTGHDDPSLFTGVVRPSSFSHGYQVRKLREH